MAFVECPTAGRLESLALGQLGTEESEALYSHVRSCPRCQDAFNEFSAPPPSPQVIAASEAETKDGDLGELLRRRSLADSPTVDFSVENERRRSPAKSKEPQDEFALGDFIECLKKSGLVHPSEIELLVEQHEPPSSRSFARSLIKKKKLTIFQASALLHGRWKGLVLGNYVVLEKLGEGGMGHVFKARHKRMGRIVCLKLLRSTRRDSPEIVHRFRREARAVGALKHPNIVVAHDADEAGGMPFLVMEYIDGPDLSRLVTENGPMEPMAAIRSARQTAEALQYAHEQGVIHRDIKPHNLLLDGDTTKVLDLGLARIESYQGNELGDTDKASMTSSDVLMGSVDYMSPEQALNCHNADARSDIYALGCTLHFLLTGDLVYSGETLMEKLIAHRERSTPRLADRVEGLPADVDKVFQRMLAKEPEDRYQDMATLALDLRAIERGAEPQELSSLPPITSRAIPVPPVASAVKADVPAIDVHRKKRRRRRRRRGFWTTGRVLIGVATLLAVATAILINVLATNGLIFKQPSTDPTTPDAATGAATTDAAPNAVKPNAAPAGQATPPGNAVGSSSEPSTETVPSSVAAKKSAANGPARKRKVGKGFDRKNLPKSLPKNGKGPFPRVRQRPRTENLDGKPSSDDGERPLSTDTDTATN